MGSFDLHSLYRPILVAMFMCTVFACDGGGCSGCEGCGVAPIPGGYPTAERIPNSAQVRVTSHGLAYLGDNAASIIESVLGTGLDFDVPRSPTNLPVIGDVVVCPDNNCVAHIEIDDLDVTPTTPNVLHLHLRLILDSRNTDGDRAKWPIDMDSIAVVCDLDIDTRRPDVAYIGIEADITFDAIAQAARLDYTEITFDDAAGDTTIGLVDGESIEDSDLEVSIGSCDGLACINPLRLGCLAVENFGPVKTLLIDQLTGQLDSLIDGALGDTLCTTRGPTECPTGTFAVPDPADAASICRYENNEDAECVPILLGTDGQGDLGGTFLGGFSPGTHAYGQFLLAAGGDGQATNGGMTLNFFGGFRGTDSTFVATPAHNSCVPVIEPPPRPTIPEAAAFRGNEIPGTGGTTAHIGFGIAEPFLDYAGYGMFDSGLLCIGAGTRLSQQLSTGLVSAAVMSLPELSFPQNSAPLAIALRPQQPPDFSIGDGTDTSPLLGIELRELEMDFYVWSTERYIRFMTFKSDLTIGINLSLEGNELVPNITGVTAANPEVLNADLLSDNATTVATLLATVLGGVAESFTSGISGFALPDIMGLTFEIPEGGITRVTEGSTDFLGIFLNFAPPTAPYTAEVETTLSLSDLEIDRTSMQPEHWAEGYKNRVWLHFDAEGPSGLEYEYSYRIDGGIWSAWTTDRRIQIDDDLLLLQARHQIEARARAVGEPLSTDTTPASQELLVDILPPTVHVARTMEGIDVDAYDIITDASNLEFRYRVGDAWSAWTTDAHQDLPLDAGPVEVEVRDEVGNVGRAASPLIRGIPDPNADGGCGCSVPSQSDRPLPFGLALLGGVLLVLGARRRRRTLDKKRVALLAFLGLGVFVSGCECGTPMTDPGPCGGSCVPASPPSLTSGQICCEGDLMTRDDDMCAAYDVDALCDPGYTCPLENLVVGDACGVTCSECMAKPALGPGTLATYLDAIVDSAGAVHVSGYSPGDPVADTDYGDLVFGTWNGATVEWEIVDGAPNGPITNDPNGWRGGVSAPGDNVGRWTSMVEVEGTYMIAYYDMTAGALKLAAGGPGSWQIHTIDDEGDSGRYASMILTSAGVPAIAYLRMIESEATPGEVRGTVMVATANLANPAMAEDWTLAEVASQPMPCRPRFCASGDVCLESGTCETPTSDCSDDCGSGKACVAGSCQTTVPNGWVEDLLPAYGLYTSLVETPTGLGVTFYDRTRGDLRGVSFDGTAWGAPFLIDGYSRITVPPEPASTDSGQSASVAVDDAGVWHVTYIDGTEERLMYAQVAPNGSVTTREVIDDGSTSNGTERFTDGRHLVGDDCRVVVDDTGAVRVIYQDATAQHAVEATRPAGGGDWSIRRFDTEGSTGYWLVHQLVGPTSYAVTWWRQRNGAAMDNGVRVLLLD